MSYPYNMKKILGDEGFTMMELVMVILLVSTLSVIAVAKWPSGLDVDSAALEYKQALRYAQHMALTREWTGPDQAWGIEVVANKYYVGRLSGNCSADCNNSDCADEMYCDRLLLGDADMSLSAGRISFNGLGEPINSSGALLGSTTFVIGGEMQVTVCQQTGYVVEGGSCP